MQAGRSAFEALGPVFTLISFEPEGPVADAFVQAAEACGVPLVVVPASEAEARARYAANHILVRPDQFVAWASDAGPAPAAREVLARAIGATG